MQDYSEITTAAAATVAGAGGYLVRILFDRKKLKAETSAAVLDTDTKAVELFERYAAALNPKIDHLEEQQQRLGEDIANLRLENTELKIENRELKAENTRLKNDMQGMHKQISELQSALEIKKQPRIRATNKGT
jgi:peptidoglycan hydrolase CwlO-like protein